MLENCTIKLLRGYCCLFIPVHELQYDSNPTSGHHHKRSIFNISTVGINENYYELLIGGHIRTIIRIDISLKVKKEKILLF